MNPTKAFADALPRVPLTEWADAHRPGDNMIWRGAAAAQFDDFRNFAADAGTVAHVIGEHRSKSIALPVVLFNFGGGAACAVIRNNFYDYKVSVLADEPIDMTDTEIESVIAGGEILDCYCEGFPSALVCGPYSKNRAAFTVEVYRAEEVRAILGAIARHAGSGVRTDVQIGKAVGS